jgi:hypothetical protein
MFVPHCRDDNACPEKKKGLEEGVGHEMEDRCRPCSHPEGKEHVAYLADRGIGEDTFYAPLRECASCCKNAGRRPDDRDKRLDNRRECKEDVGSGNEIYAGGHHGRGMNQGRDRRGTGHRIRKPCLERELGGLSNRSSQKQEGRPECHARTLIPPPRRRRKDFLYVQRIKMDEEEEKADCECRVADAGHDKGLVRGFYIRRVIVPEPDQEIAAEPHPFPSEIEEKQIVRHDEHLHGAYEEVHAGEEAPQVCITGHVFGRIEEY